MDVSDLCKEPAMRAKIKISYMRLGSRGFTERRTERVIECAKVGKEWSVWAFEGSGDNSNLRLATVVSSWIDVCEFVSGHKGVEVLSFE